jgi:predicted PurR-regulated permease PerM
MGLATAAKLIFLLSWPFFILLIFYLVDKERFRKKVKRMLDRIE